MKTALRDLWRNQGQGMTEYGLILAVFVVVVVGAVAVLGPKLPQLYANTNSLLQ